MSNTPQRALDSSPKPTQQLPIGQSSFEAIIREGLFYVDKTPLIGEIWKQGLVLLIPRPRRFGKTLSMNMLRDFFERTKPNKAHLFKNLAIAQDEEMMALQGCFPVIFLSFRKKAGTAADCLEDIRTRIADEYKRHAQDLLPDLNQWDRDYYYRIVELRASNIQYQNALKKLSQFLHQHYSQRVIILIDEYDTPMIAAYNGNFLQEVQPFWRGLLSEALKDNEHLEKGVLTGIMRIAKESVFSGLNNLEILSFLQPPCSDKFGLTEREVASMLTQYSLSSESEKVRDWYNGYTFGPHRMYNPWSIINFVKNRRLDSYWLQTSGNEIIRDLVRKGNPKLPEALGGLLHGETVQCSLQENIAFGDLNDSLDLILSFLLFTGYLAVDELPQEGSTGVNLRIPNKEIRNFFTTTFSSWLKDAVGSESLRGLLHALTHGDISKFEAFLQDLVAQMMGYHDPTGDDPERVYHAFVLGLLANLDGEYEVRSNRESGFGRYDIALTPRSSDQTCIILEFKKVTHQEPEQALDEALTQIKTMDYAMEFRDRGYSQIKSVAVVFQSKRVWVKGEALTF